MLISYNPDDIRREFALIFSKELKKEVLAKDIRICSDEDSETYIEYRVKF